MDIDNINEVLDALAERFGSTGAHLWEVLIKQQYVNASLSLLWIVITIMCAIFFVKMTIKANQVPSRDEDPFIIMAIVGGIASFVMLIVSAMNIHYLGAFFNPDYYALKAIGKLF